MVTRLVVASTLIVLLTGCGSDPGVPVEATSGGGGQAGESGDGAGAAPEEELTVERGPTCGALDLAAVADAVGLTARRMQSSAMKPGDPYEIPGGGKQKATNWSCSVRTRPSEIERQVYLSLIIYGDDFGLAERDRSLEESTGFVEADNGRCEVSEVDGWGAHGVHRTCTREKKETAGTYSPGSTMARYEGLFGSTRVVCDGASYPAGGDRAFVRAVDAVCHDALAALAR